MQFFFVYLYIYMHVCVHNSATAVVLLAHLPIKPWFQRIQHSADDADVSTKISIARRELFAVLRAIWAPTNEQPLLGLAKLVSALDQAIPSVAQNGSFRCVTTALAILARIAEVPQMFTTGFTWGATCCAMRPEHQSTVIEAKLPFMPAHTHRHTDAMLPAWIDSLGASLVMSDVAAAAALAGACDACGSAAGPVTLTGIDAPPVLVAVLPRVDGAPPFTDRNSFMFDIKAFALGGVQYVPIALADYRSCGFGGGGSWSCQVAHAIDAGVHCFNGGCVSEARSQLVPTEHTSVCVYVDRAHMCTGSEIAEIVRRIDPPPQLVRAHMRAGSEIAEYVRGARVEPLPTLVRAHALSAVAIEPAEFTTCDRAQT